MLSRRKGPDTRETQSESETLCLTSVRCNYFFWIVNLNESNCSNAVFLLSAAEEAEAAETKEKHQVSMCHMKRLQEISRISLKRSI